MLTDSPGIHHVTGIVRDAQSNVSFYRDVLGLRLVKRTVNFEDRFTRHLYFGNETGDPGTVATFFPYPAEEGGRLGKPQVSAVAFAVPPDSVGYWRDRLAARDVAVTGPTERFDQPVLAVRDPDGTHVELVGADSTVEPWTGGSVPERAAIRGVHSATLLSGNPYAAASVLETLGFDLVGQENDRVRYRAPGDRATVVDIHYRDADYGREGAGTLQHVAVRVASVDELYEWHDLFRDRDVTVSRVKDRHFFHSLYVREPGGVLFELATETPGLTAEGDVAALGNALYLPPQFERDRDTIESQLPPVDFD